MRQSLLIFFFFLLASCSGHERALPTEPGPAPAPLTTATVRLDAGLNARDFFVSDPKCIVQYGTVRNAQSRRPIAGAKVSRHRPAATSLSR